MAQRVSQSFELVEAQEVTDLSGGIVDGVVTDNARQMAHMPEPVSEYYNLDGKSAAIITTLLCGAIIFSACIAESFHYVNFDEYALLQDVYGSVRLSKVYGEGRYFFPLNYDLIIFPASYHSVAFDAVVFTDSGLEFSVEVDFYYRVPKEKLGDIYDSFSSNYHDRVVSNAQTTIKNIAAPLSIDDYMVNRSHVQRLFAESVRDVLQANVLVEAPVELFRIGEVRLPPSIIERSLESAIAIQRNEILANTQEVVVIRSETEKLVAEIDAQRNQVLNFALNKADLIIEDSNSFARQVDIRARGLGIATMLSTLNFTTSNYTMDIVNRLAQLDNTANTKYVTARALQYEVNV